MTKAEPFSLNSWNSSPLTSFKFASIGTRAIATSKISPAGISSSVWPLLSSLIAKVSAISKPVFVLSNPSSIIWASGANFSQHVGTRQRTPRLADLRRFRPSLDCRRSRPLPWRIFWSGAVRDRVCLRLDDHRFVSVAFPVGKIPPPQERGETAHAARSAGQHSDPCLRDRRPSSRREHFGPVASRSRSVYLLDRGYVDFARLYVLAQACAFFVTHAKKNMQFYRRSSLPIKRSAGLRSDQTILLTGVRTGQHYPDPLRHIHYFDAERDSRLAFLTNNFLRFWELASRSVNC